MKNFKKAKGLNRPPEKMCKWQSAHENTLHITSLQGNAHGKLTTSRLVSSQQCWEVGSWERAKLHGHSPTYIAPFISSNWLFLDCILLTKPQNNPQTEEQIVYGEMPKA